LAPHRRPQGSGTRSSPDGGSPATLAGLPIPPLDGGRVLLGFLPRPVAQRFAQLEPYGIPILLGLMFVLPLVGQQLGMSLDVLSWIISSLSSAIRDFLVYFVSATAAHRPRRSRRR
jgi:Zn-dependent protease